MIACGCIRLVRDDRDGFADRYAHARELQLDGIADEILDIVDDSRNDFIARESKSGDVQLVFDREHVDRTRLRVDARKWLLTKLKPQKFSDRVEQTHKGDAFMALWQSLGGKDTGGRNVLHNPDERSGCHHFFRP